MSHPRGGATGTSGRGTHMAVSPTASSGARSRGFSLRARGLVALVGLATLTGCAFPDGSDGSREGERVPVPDAVLFDAVSELPGVAESGVQYEDTLPNGSRYSGHVEAEASADPLCVLDQVYALLWQGRDATVSVSVVQDGVITTESDLGVSGNQFMGELEDRYGRRPKDGVFVEPETPPACR